MILRICWPICGFISNPSFVAGIIGLSLFVRSSLAFAEEPKLTNIIVTNTKENLLLYLTVEGAFTEPMKELVMKGVPTEFSYYIKLFKSRSYWMNKSLADLTLTHSVQYDTKKKEFHVKRSWEPEKKHVVASIEDAKSLLCEIDSLKVAPIWILEKGIQYQIQAKAEFKKKTLPYYLHYVVFFISLWDFATDWYTIDFIY